MNRASSIRAFAALLLLSACTRSLPPTTDAPPRSSPANGRTTRITAANAPDTVALLPEVRLPAPPFSPTDPVRTGAIAHMRTFTTDDGLPMDDIMCGTLDRNGMLWFGTNGGGITRYDGRSFTNFSTADGLPDNVILSLLSDSQGILWIATSTGGLCKDDGRSCRSIVLNDATGLAKGISSIVEDGTGTLWFGTRGRGVYTYDGSNFTRFTANDGLVGEKVRAMTKAADGSIWVATTTGVSRFSEGKATTYAESQGHALNDVWCMTFTDAHTLWLGHEKGGVTRCTVNAGDVVFQHDPVVPENDMEVSALAPVDRHSEAIWVGSIAHGVTRFEPRPGAAPRVQRFTTANGLAGNEVLSITKGAHGDLWFGMRGAGLCQYRGEAFMRHTSFRPISLAEDRQGVLYAGTSLGIARREGDGFSEWHPEGGFSSWTYSVSSDRQGRVGFAENLVDLGRAGFSTIEGDQVRVLGAEAKRVDIFWSMHDRRDRLWLAGRRGIERWSDGHGVRYGPEQGIGNINGLCLLERRDGSIWAGTDGGGLSRIDSASITTWTTEEGLPNNVVWCMAEDQGGALWIATLAGLVRYDGRTFLTFNTTHGLPDNNIHQLLITRDGTLIVGTLQGIAVLTGWVDADGRPALRNELLPASENDGIAHLRPVFEVYNSATGHPVKDVQTSERSLFEDAQGVIWIATGSDKSGLVRFDRKALYADTLAPGLHLLSVDPGEERLCWYGLRADVESATLGQQEIRTYGRVLSDAERRALRERYKAVRFTGIAPHFPVPQDLELDHRNNRITFTYVAVETARPEGVAYQHMLEGYDAHWSPSTAANSATYGNIREGTYTFRVKARNAAGAWGPALEYRFTVRPPWYRTWWGYTLYVLCAGGLVLLYIRIRLSALRRQKERLERTVDQRTEELRHQKEEADHQRERAEHSEKAKEQFLANVSHEIRTPMNAIMGMSDILRNRPHAPEQAKYLNAIAQSSENLLVIINDILDLSKIDAGRIEFESVPFAPREVLANVKDVLHLKAEEKGLALTLNVDADVPARLIGDPTRLNQVVMNLAGNAIKFTERGSVTIHLHARNDPAGRPAHCMLVIDVMDTGISIPEDRLEKIFEEFTQAYSDTTRKYGGTGLGLTISKRLTELQGGSIHVKSERDKGSTFTVLVPYALPTSIDTSPPA
ncbi:MAG: two-component regulator propeller domain-containing protein [Flavobacteriales bacterium]